MLNYISKRLLWAIPTLIGVSLLVFFMVHLVPGNPARVMLGKRANPEAIKKIEKQLGLDKPLYEQYFIFVKNASTGDFGTSIISQQPVMTEFKDRFPATIELSLLSMFFAVLLGVAAGVVSAVKRYSIYDYASMTGALAGVSMPVFWLGLVLIYIFSVKLGWFPVSGRISIQLVDFSTRELPTGLYLLDSLLLGDMAAFRSALRHLILPAIALATIPGAIIARMTRASMLETLQKDYVKTAKAKGCSPSRVIFVHTLRNALIPVVTIIGLMMGALLAGAVLTETTFGWPGVGKWLVKAVEQRDFPIIQGATLIIAVLFILLNLAVDVLYAFLNPEIRLD